MMANVYNALIVMFLLMEIVKLSVTNAKLGIKLLYVLNVIMVTHLLMGNVKFLKQLQPLNLRLNLLLNLLLNLFLKLLLNLFLNLHLHLPMILYVFLDLLMENVLVATLDLYLLTMFVLL
jgi:hypothetical protein